MSDLCVQDHGDDDRRAADGLRLCHSCRRYLLKLISGMPQRYFQLGEKLATGGTSGDRVSGSTSAPLPINTAVADHRDQIRHDLVWWCIYVADARGHGLPSSSEPRATAAWLAKHCDWLSADPVAAEECLPTMRALNGRAWALIDPDGAKRIAIGPCTQTGENGRCEGVLYATVRADDDPRPSAIRCEVCGFELAPERWLRFGKTYQRQMTA